MYRFNWPDNSNTIHTIEEHQQCLHTINEQPIYICKLINNSILFVVCDGFCVFSRFCLHIKHIVQWFSLTAIVIIDIKRAKRLHFHCSTLTIKIEQCVDQCSTGARLHFGYCTLILSKRRKKTSNVETYKSSCVLQNGIMFKLNTKNFTLLIQ